jgi:hypothetical protein
MGDLTGQPVGPSVDTLPGPGYKGSAFDDRFPFCGDRGILRDISAPQRPTRNRVLGVGVRNRLKDSDVPSPTESLVTATRSDERYKLTMVCATREPGFQI